MEKVDTLLIDHLDLWTSAIARRSSAGPGRSRKFNLHGIEKLRSLILDLAVRGKLVPQDPSDESSTILLRRFHAENIDWIAKKRMRKAKQLPPVHAEEIRYKAPDGWSWIRLNQLGDWGAGATPNRKRSDYYGGGIPWFKSGELTSDFVSISEETVTDLALEECSLRLNKPGDVLIAMYGATIGKTSILAVEGTTNQAVCACTPFTGACNRYLLLALKAMRPLFVGQGAGGAQPNISREKIIATAFALPPEAEQHRIVAKVEELMALCDRLEADTYAAIEAHQLLVKELLATLTASRDAGELAENWALIETQFDTLFVTEDSVDQLKKTILQLALRGVLTQQKQLDEPATRLFEKIVKQKLSFHKGRKKDLIMNAISESDHPYTLPKSWTWCRFGDLVEFQTELVKPEEFQDLFQIAPDLIEKGTGRLLGRRTVAEAGIRGPNNRFYKGQILYSKIRPSLSKAIIAEFDGLCSADMYPLKSFVPSKYLLLVILSEDFLVQVRQAENRIKMPKLNVESLSDILVPLPPKEEQERIIATLDELSARCDVLRSNISDAGDLQKKLADAIVSQAEAWDF